jgi:hypothetical protein
MCMSKVNFENHKKIWVKSKENLKLNQNEKTLLQIVAQTQPATGSSFEIRILSSTPHQKGYKIL